MKIELIEEVSPTNGTMFLVKINGDNIKWFAQKSSAEAFYLGVIADPTMLETKRNILQSHEINVSLNEQNS
jgi:hypothetical protein